MRVLIFLLILFFFVETALAEEFFIPAQVTISPIYSLSLEIDILNDKILSGDYLNVSVELIKTDLAEIGAGEEITVDLYYEIFRPQKGKFKENKTIIASDFAGTIDIVDKKEEVIQIPIPSDIMPGKYILNIKASHPQATADSDYDKFWVKRKGFLGILDYLGIF